MHQMIVEIIEKTMERIPGGIYPIESINKRDLKKTIEKKPFSLITEVKFSSPSKGKITDIKRIVKQMEMGGSDAISVLTEPHYFGGNFVSLIKKMTKLPVLRKDFIIDEKQLIESKNCGADAILLIVSLFGEKLGGFIEIFSVDIKRTVELAKHIPKDVIFVSESRIQTFDDIKLLLNCGVNAFLVGSSIRTSGDICKKVGKLKGV